MEIDSAARQPPRRGRRTADAEDFTPHQQKIIKRYYDSQDTIQSQRLAELVGELYLASGKKARRSLEARHRRHAKARRPAGASTIFATDNAALVAEVVKELEGEVTAS